MNNTTNFISNLSKDVKPFSLSSLSSFITPWTLRFLGYVILTLLILPHREGLMDKMTTTTFLVESSLWFMTALAGALVTYFSSVPGLATSKYLKTMFFLALALVLVVFMRENWSMISQEFLEELSLHRGRCGFIIMGIAFVESSIVSRWMKTQAPTNAALSGLSIAMASGCVASFMMQLICSHENSLHIGMWHFIPIFLLSYIGSVVGSKLFKW